MLKVIHTVESSFVLPTENLWEVKKQKELTKNRIAIYLKSSFNQDSEGLFIAEICDKGDNKLESKAREFVKALAEFLIGKHEIFQVYDDLGNFGTHRRDWERYIDDPYV